MKKAFVLVLFILLAQFTLSYAAGMNVVDVAPVIHLQQPAIAIIFDKKVDIKANYDQYITIKGVKSKGIVDADQQIIYYIGLKHSTDYEVSVNAGLKGRGSNISLTNGYSKTVTTNALLPSARFASTGVMVVPSDKAVLPVTVTNIDTILVSFYRESTEELFQGGNLSVRAYNIDTANFIVSKAYNVSALNKQFDTNLELPKELFGNHGAYRAVIQDGRSYYRLSVSSFIVSDLGIQLRRHPDGSWDIWARSFKTGQPVAGVTGQFYYSDGKLSIANTDATGHSSILASALPATPYRFVAQKGDDIAIVTMSRVIDLSDFNIAGRAHADMQLYVYGPRDLYRGGEEVRYNMLARDHDGNFIDPGSIQIVLTDPRGEEKEDEDVRLDEEGYGLYEYSYKLPENAPTGVWKLTTTIGKNVSVHNFSVEDFMPETMRLILGKPGEQLIVDKAIATTLNAHGEYLYGAVAEGNSVDGQYIISPAMYVSDKWRDYKFANDETTNRIRGDLSGGKLNSNGDYSWDVSSLDFSSVEALKQPVRIKYFTTLYESGGRALNRLKEYVYLPTGQAIGIRAEDYGEYASTTKPTKFNIVNIDSTGNAAKAKLQITLLREERSYYWDYNSSGGWRNHYTSAIYPVQERTVDIGTKPIEQSFSLRYGWYKLVVKNLTTQQETSIDNIRAGYYYYDDEDNDDDDRNIKPDELTITFDKKAYKEGSNARVTVSSPYDGQGMVFVESTSGKLWSQKINVIKNKATVTMPVGATWNRHDIYVSAYVARNEKELEKTQNSLVYGIAHLPIDRLARKIEIETIYPAIAEPDKDFEVLIRAKNGAQSAGAMVTLAAVDQGILSLKAFETPDAWKYFFGRKRYSSIIYDNFWQVIHKYSAKMAIRYGGSDEDYEDDDDDDDIDDDFAAVGGELARADVNIVSFFSKPIKLDAKGEARIKLNIPSYNGELRMMTMAFSKNAFGMDEGVIKIAQPIVTELSTPRFLATGDTVTLALDLRNMTSEGQNLTVETTISQPLQLTSGKIQSQKLTLKANARQLLYIPVKAIGSSGYGTVSVKVSGLKQRKIAAEPFVKEWRIAVRSPYPAVTKAMQFIIEPNTPVSFFSEDLSRYVADSAYFSVSIDSKPPMGEEPHFAYLLQYPYGCLEQTTSSTFPLVYATDEVRKRYNMVLPGNQSRAQLVDIGLNRLYDKQLSNGGFGYWYVDSSESPYGSVYASELLNEANKRGFKVNQERLNKANGRLASYIRGDAKPTYSSYYDSQSHYSIATKAYAAYVLARYSSVSLADVRAVYADSANSKSPVPLMHLAIALKKAGDAEKASEAFGKATQLTTQDIGYYGDYSSSTRDEAWMMALYLEYMEGDEGGLHHKLMLSSMITNITSYMKNKSWFSTQERLRLFMAATAIDMSSEEAIKGTITAGGKTEAINTKKYTGVWRAKNLEGEISYISANQDNVFARMEFSAYPLTKPDVLSTNASVARGYYDLEGNKINIGNVKVGDFVLVHLAVHSALNTADGLVVDLLPAGFELENQNLDNSKKLSSITLPKDENAIAEPVYSEYRDDRFVAAVNIRKGDTVSVYYIMRAVTPGEYSNPVPYFEDMYRPDVRAVGEATPEHISIAGK